MNIRRLVVAVFIVALVIIASATPAAGKDKWISLRTKNFNIVSNAGERDSREVALKLEQFRLVFSKLFNIRSVAPVPVTVVVFKSDDSFKPFKPLYKGKPANVAGYFQRGEDKNLITLNISANGEHPMATIYHEYTHLLTSYTRRSWPAWLMEGLAEVYSSFEVKKNEVTLGAPISNHVFYLRENKFIPIDALFRVDRSSPAYNERDKQGVFYAQSWALAHYLMFGDKSVRQPLLVQFIRLFESGVSLEEAFLKAFQTDFATMEKRLRSYIGNSSYSVTIYTLDSTEGDKQIDLRPLSEAEVQFQLGDLLLHSHRMDEAATYFKQAMALDSGLAGPYEGLGFIAMRRNSIAEAKLQFKEAVARDSKNHLAHYYYAQALLRESSESGRVSGIDSETARTLVAELKTVTALMPGFAPAYDLLGVVCLVTGENLEDGVKALSTARQIEPQNKRFGLTLAQLQMRMNDYEAAKQTLQPLLASDAEPELKSSAQSIMSVLDSLTRPRSSQDEPPDSSPETETKGREAPRLKRREPGSPTDRSGPFVRMPDTEVISGVLAVIECDGRGSMTLAVRTPEKLLRFLVSDPAKLIFYSQDPQLTVDIKCGPMNLPIYVHYKPAPGGQARFFGEAIAVEFRSKK